MVATRNICVVALLSLALHSLGAHAHLTGHLLRCFLFLLPSVAMLARAKLAAMPAVVTPVFAFVGIPRRAETRLRFAFTDRPYDIFPPPFSPR